MHNLCNTDALPQFSTIAPDNIEPALDHCLHHNRNRLNELLKETPTWQSLVLAIEEMEVRLDDAWATVEHLNNVTSTEAIRKAYRSCLPKLTAYHVEMGQNEQLYRAYQSIADSESFKTLAPAQQKVVQDALRDFRLSGVHLPMQQKNHFRDIQEQLAKLSTQFEENVLDTTDVWEKHVTDEECLQGLPEHALKMANQLAREKSKPGWLFNLTFPSYFPIMTYANNRELRHEFYYAYVTRASDIGPHDKKYDNSSLMIEILTLRQKLAQLLDFPNYAEVSLVPKMAQSPHQVLAFLNDLATRAHGFAEQEYQQLSAYAKQLDGIETLEAWDIAYYSEKLRVQLFDVDQEELRNYFPEDHVLSGLFTIVQRLYHINIQPAQQAIELWHPDVRYYELFDAEGQLIGGFYFDLYARPQKQGGAWMDGCRTRYRDHTGKLHLPVAYLNCNFSAPLNGQAALFTHDEVLTLFHEFGHGLHHLLTEMEYPSISGINGVAWDAVEFPSQFMENWCWCPEGLQLISRHTATGEHLPTALLDNLLRSKHFQAGMDMTRQLIYALFDLRIHMEFDAEHPEKIQHLLQEIREKIAVTPFPTFNRFQHSFTHIFAGGYAAGYYSYKWAEVLACDAFSEFQKQGVLDSHTGQRFLKQILAQGGGTHAMDLFVDFMGREPRIDALLLACGLQ